MKTLVILGALALSVPAISKEDKHYQYKDISQKEARPLPEGRRDPGSVEGEFKRPAKTIEEKIQDSRARKNQ